MRNVTLDKVGFEWSHYTALSPTIRRNLRHLFAGSEFAGRIEDAPSLAAATAGLPAFHLFDIGDQIHSSRDGQRFETQIDTSQARHSPKYYGLGTDISACTAVANEVPFNMKVIGEHESHYVFDLLYNNTSDIRSQVHSTPTRTAPTS